VLRSLTAGEKLGPIFFNTQAYLASLDEDIRLILAAFSAMVEEANADLPKGPHRCARYSIQNMQRRQRN